MVVLTLYRHTCTKAQSPGPPVCLVSTSFLPPLLGHSGSWLRPQTSEHTYQVTQGAGQLFGNFKLPGCGEDITFPMHEEIQGSPLHKLFHHDIYKHKNSHICNLTSIWDSTPRFPQEHQFSDRHSARQCKWHSASEPDRLGFKPCLMLLLL